jgi:hypothetical protein
MFTSWVWYQLDCKSSGTELKVIFAEKLHFFIQTKKLPKLLLQPRINDYFSTCYWSCDDSYHCRFYNRKVSFPNIIP